jgi:hypothetical protein
MSGRNNGSGNGSDEEEDLLNDEETNKCKDVFAKVSKGSDYITVIKFNYIAFLYRLMRLL